MDEEERINIGWTLFNAISALHSLSDVVLTPKARIAVDCASKLIDSITDADLYPNKEEEKDYEDKFVEGWRVYGFSE